MFAVEEASKEFLPQVLVHAPLLSVVVAFGGVLISLILAYTSLRTVRGLKTQLKLAQQQTDMAERTQTSQIFFTISKLWTDIYQQRNALLSTPRVTLDDLEARYGSNYKLLLKESSWIDVRLVCNFFETLGVMIEQQAIPLKLLFALVTVDVYKDVDEGGRHIASPDGVMYSRLKPYILYLRKHYRPDIYDYYDMLVAKFKAHLHSQSALAHHHAA